MNASGLYIHVPFCRTRCRYCDFYRVGERADRVEAFLGALHREIEETPHGGAEVDTVFLGGGTPSLLAPPAVERILGALSETFELRAGAEISMEANPSDLDAERIAAYRSVGVTRLSLGVQSFSDRELSLLGRRHDADRAAEVLTAALAAGFPDGVSADVMIGIPGQTRGGFSATLDRLLGIGPDHVSAYILEVHEGTEFDGLLRMRPDLFPSEGETADRYRALVMRLERAGYDQYEISNFARDGRRCRHNLKYWRGDPVIGFGPAAHSTGAGTRWRHEADLARYLADPLRTEEVPSEPGPERIFLGLRLSEGVLLSEMGAHLGLAEEELRGRLRPLESYLRLDEDRVRFTLDGFLLSTDLMAEILSWESA